jgi:CDP-diacylglycerol--serine O-phosphatidyltransferase
MPAKGSGADGPGNFVRPTAYGVEATAAHIQRTKTKFKRFRLIRSLALSDFITLANAACGTCSIFFCLNFLENSKYQPYIAGAFVLLPFALIFDILDGSVARCRKRSSPYGLDLDSLADVVSFSVAPAVLGFTLGLRGFYDCVFLSYFVCCGISRLARYNVTAPFLSHLGKVKHYEGFPVPTSLLIVLILGVLYRFELVFDKFLFGAVHDILGPGFGSFHWFSFIYFAFGCLMISEVKIPKP